MSGTTNTRIDRIVLNDFLTSYLSSLGWYADDEDEMDALNDVVHTTADAIETLPGIEKTPMSEVAA